MNEPNEPIKHCVLQNKTIQITIGSRTYRPRLCIAKKYEAREWRDISRRECICVCVVCVASVVRPLSWQRLFHHVFTLIFISTPGRRQESKLPIGRHLACASVFTRRVQKYVWHGMYYSLLRVRRPKRAHAEKRNSNGTRLVSGVIPKNCFSFFVDFLLLFSSHGVQTWNKSTGGTGGHGLHATLR